MPLPIGVGGGLGGIGLLIFLAIVLLSGGLPGGGQGAPLDPLNPVEQPAPGSATGTDPDANLKEFVSFLVTDIQNQWETIFRESGEEYQRTQLVLFTQGVQSGCGAASSATGPFYCPRDMRVYLDMDFFRELRNRFEAAGDFAQAYVIAHEFGHHVQNLLGTNERVREDPRPGANSASVALELQADCYAGIWGHAASQQGRLGAGKVELEPGDAEEALQAAAAIGDDRLQRMASGRVAPERFTHGSSAQRMEWFRRGMTTGDPAQCDTFAAR